MASKGKPRRLKPAIGYAVVDSNSADFHDYCELYKSKRYAQIDAKKMNVKSGDWYRVARVEIREVE